LGASTALASQMIDVQALYAGPRMTYAYASCA